MNRRLITLGNQVVIVEDGPAILAPAVNPYAGIKLDKVMIYDDLTDVTPISDEQRQRLINEWYQRTTPLHSPEPTREEPCAAMNPTDTPVVGEPDA
jgi:hypothetical protein